MALKQNSLQQTWRGGLSDYITAIAWSPQGGYLAACSAAGEVVLFTTPTFQMTRLQGETGQSVDCLAFSHDGQFLAVAGQNGQVNVWQLQSDAPVLVTHLANPSVWIDRLGWNPMAHQLAFSLGKYVQIWDVITHQVVTTLHFASSTVLDLNWRNDGNYLALGGYQGIKIWDATDWDVDAQELEIASAAVAIAWSGDNQFIATGNLDNTLFVAEASRFTTPWIMRGFPSKVRQLVWSSVPTRIGVPLLASASGAAVVVWERDADEQVGWASRVLGNHEAMVQAIAFQPGSLLLASAAQDGWVALWHRATRLIQVLEGANRGFSTLAWHPQGQYLAAGGMNGELIIWSQALRGQGFGKR